MHIGIIGAGKVGCSIGKYLVDSGILLTGYYSKTHASAVGAAEFTGTHAFENMVDIISASDTLFITTPDDGIGEVWDCIARCNIEEKIICHFSGSLSSVVFSGIEQKGAAGCSIHPMLAFSDKFSSYRQLNSAIFTIEGMEDAVCKIKGIFTGMGNTVLEMKSEEKSRYHAAASMLSNHMIALYQTGIDNLLKCGFDEKSASELVKPLVRNNVEAFLEKGSKEALTGPIERNDVKTVKKHLDILTGDDREIYRLLGKKLVSLAKEKNHDRDYRELEEVFGERKITK